MELHLTRTEAGKLLGVRPAGVSDWEAGRYEPSAGHWPSILAFLGYDPSPEPESFAQKLDAIRRQRGWGLWELAEHLGVSCSTMTRWQAGGAPWNRRSRTAVVRLLSEHGLGGPGDPACSPEPTEVASVAEER